MNDYSHLSEETKSKIEELKRQRKLTLPVGSSSEYNRLTAAIQYLRRPETIRRSIYRWRDKNAGRIKYERESGIAYKQSKRRKPLTPEQKLRHKEAMRRHEAKNPQRIIRQRIERTLINFYHICASGQIDRRPRFRTESLLGCTPVYFREHIRLQLHRKSWLWSDWRKKWTMDHVVPVRRFNLPKEERSCYHYTNLRPLAKHLNHRGYKG